MKTKQAQKAYIFNLQKDNIIFNMIRLTLFSEIAFLLLSIKKVLYEINYYMFINFFIYILRWIEFS
jgi:hypothetical protein